VLDCVTDAAATMKMCYEAIGAQGGTYIALEPTTNTVKYTRRDVRADWVMANTLLGDPCELEGIYGRPGAPEHRLFAGRLFRLAERWLREGKISNHPLEIRDEGLESVDPGLQDLRAGIIRGKKLVVPLAVGA
jgi:aspyridone synthetase trans-acting enoyl reductase